MNSENQYKTKEINIRKTELINYNCNILYNV